VLHGHFTRRATYSIVARRSRGPNTAFADLPAAMTDVM